MRFTETAEARIGAALNGAARVAAYFGGAILLALAVMTVVSVVGRAFTFAGLRPIRGDFELVEAGTAIAVFMFLPWCQMQRGHVTVDLLVRRMSPRLKAFWTVIGDAALALISGLILWRLYLGFGEKFPFFEQPMRDALAMGFKPFFPETSYELQFPVWVPFGFATIGALLFFATSLFSVWCSAKALIGRGGAR
ncbi:MAG: TRAP transporter small permease [Pseudomonadota bacterium]